MEENNDGSTWLGWRDVCEFDLFMIKKETCLFMWNLESREKHKIENKSYL